MLGPPWGKVNLHFFLHSFIGPIGHNIWWENRLNMSSNYGTQATISINPIPTFCKSGPGNFILTLGLGLSSFFSDHISIRKIDTFIDNHIPQDEDQTQNQNQHNTLSKYTGQSHIKSTYTDTHVYVAANVQSQLMYTLAS